MGYRPRVEILSGCTPEAIERELSSAVDLSKLLDLERPEAVFTLRPDQDDPGRYQLITPVISDAVLDQIHAVFLHLCRITDWELLLDWDDATADDREYMYRPRGTGAPQILDLDDPKSPIWTA